MGSLDGPASPPIGIHFAMPHNIFPALNCKRSKSRKYPFPAERAVVLSKANIKNVVPPDYRERRSSAFVLPLPGYGIKKGPEGPF
ncbi:hypothetical protein HGP16_06755 [Rhizobium sp. P40RR-XXII]|uniref:hypothetical protein n=1 Tax=unclassified Rhizobium TaxID=2613769 RepID=UPI0014568096|nr:MULTISPECIES: hypothetical protein [unclassified Rhizobium]NLR84836.1 hypothetical protein [Rhizobium sp. P28RR-XV]NLS16257.1 hypothetical protein [Rhizobium sp. P40RR-XXII]